MRAGGAKKRDATLQACSSGARGGKEVQPGENLGVGIPSAVARANPNHLIPVGDGDGRAPKQLYHRVALGSDE